VIQMTRPAIDFWFSIGSTYSYLTVMRVEDVAREHGITIRWRPFDVRAIMIEMDNLPFTHKPIKARYMWRDIERRATTHGLPWSGIPPYPIKHLPFANRIALIGAKDGWCAQYAKAAYQRWFVKGQDPSIEPDLSGALQDIGQNPERAIAAAASEELKAALNTETNAARALGIFGSPTFVTEGEIFWGDDRLEDAIAWYRKSGAQ
jgi:2-hydroxychromene-2-carboxylate isomerase